MSSSWPRDQTCVSHIGKQILYHWATRKAFSSYVNMLRINPDTLCPLPEVHSHTSSPAPMRCLVNFFLSRLLTHSQTLFFRSLGLLSLWFTSLPAQNRWPGLPLQFLPFEQTSSPLSLWTTSKQDYGSQQSTFSLHPQIKPTHLWPKHDILLLHKLWIMEAPLEPQGWLSAEGDAVIVVTRKSEPSAHGPSRDLWPCLCLILDEPLAFYRPIWNNSSAASSSWRGTQLWLHSSQHSGNWGNKYLKGKSGQSTTKSILELN